MDNRTAKRIFDPFFTLKNRGEGTGLGLSVVHGIVTHHNGTVQVQSQPGQGTTLRVFLPQGAADTPPAPAPEPETAGTENTLSGIRLLMVDDEEVIVSSVRRVLENYGYIVVGAADGKQALRLFQENPSAFDVVISDVAMPGMSGVELAKELLSIRPEVPVILCSGYQDVPDASQLLQTGVRAVMKKPLNFSEIDAVIRQQLRRTH
jgi:CheY-like chemotaxis protein